MKKHNCLITGNPIATHEQGVTPDGFTLAIELNCGCKIEMIPGDTPHADWVISRENESRCEYNDEN